VRQMQPDDTKQHYLHGTKHHHLPRVTTSRHFQTFSDIIETVRFKNELFVFCPTPKSEQTNISKTVQYPESKSYSSYRSKTVH
jgi:hypothetical protein